MFSAITGPAKQPTLSALPVLWARSQVLYSLVAFALWSALTGCGSFLSREGNQSALFLGWAENGIAQVFRFDAADGVKQLTHFDSDVHDYAASPDGSLIALAVQNADGTAIWTISDQGRDQTHHYDCRSAECFNFSWASDSRRLLFEKRPLGTDGISTVPTLWWIDTASSAVRPLAEDLQTPETNGRLSPDGAWLSYHSPSQEGTVFFNLLDERSRFLLNEIGSAAAWSPDGDKAVLPQVDLIIIHGDDDGDHEKHTHDYQTAVHLVLVDMHSDQHLDLSGNLAVEDSAPAWSPDGQWIAFGRRASRTGSARQLWLVRSDGTEARQLTVDPAHNYGPPSWSADGRSLLAQEIAQEDPQAEPSIVLIDIATGTKRELISSGMQPSWLP